jgi:hypothetical protein
MFFGPLDNPKNRRLPDVNVREVVAIAPLIALIFVIGLFPNLFLSRMEEGVRATLDRYRDGLKAYSEAGPNATTATLTSRRGGPLEAGYPEPKADPEGTSPSPAPQALNAEAAR